MTIGAGATILAADLDALTGTQLAVAAADAAGLPIGGEISLRFDGLTAAIVASNPERCKATFTAPYDLLVETLAVTVTGHDLFTTVSVALSSPGVLDSFSIGVSEAAGTDPFSSSRTLYDGSANLTGRRIEKALRVIPKGAVVDVIVSTTNTLTTATMHIVIPFRAFFGER